VVMNMHTGGSWSEEGEGGGEGEGEKEGLVT
jgi:hypothetical protein